MQSSLTKKHHIRLFLSWQLMNPDKRFPNLSNQRSEYALQGDKRKQGSKMSNEPIKPQDKQAPQTQAQTPQAQMPQNNAHPSAAQQPVAKKSTSGLAVAGLVLGLIALLSCWIPLFNVVTTPLAILGLVFAIIGIVATAPAKPKGGRGIAIAGTVLCAISLVVFMAMYGGAAASVNDTSSDSSSSSQASATAEDTQDTSDDAAQDETAQDEEDSNEDSGIVIKSCKAGKDYSGKKTAVITIEWTNNTDDSQAFFTEYSYTAYVDGEEADRTFGSGKGWYEDQTKIKPGKNKTIKLMYDWDGKSDIEFEVTSLFGFEDILSETLAVK